MKKYLLATAAATLLAMPANAAVVLNFEGIASNLDSNYPFVQDFYNGGTSSDGTSGANLGVSFSSNAQAICLNTQTRTCSNTSRGGIGDPGSQDEALFFLSGSETFMNVAAGFDTGFSFNYSADNQGGSVSVFDGLNGTGNLLGTLALPTNGGSCPGFNAGFCPFEAAGLAFAGIGRSISFAGVANQIVFDDVTFGSVTPGGAVPEPATWAFMIFGFGAIGGAMRRQRKANVKVSFA